MKKLTSKKILATVLTVMVFSLFALPVLASTGGGTFGINNVNIGLSNTDLKTAINNIIKIILGFLGLIAVIIILYGGFMWMTAAGDPGKVDKAKKLITAGIIGMVIILSAYIIASYVLGTVANSING